MAVAKEVQYIVQGLRCVFLPPASPAFGGVASTAALLVNQKQDRPFYMQANIRVISLHCWATQKESRGHSAFLEEISI